MSNNLFKISITFHYICINENEFFLRRKKSMAWLTFCLRPIKKKSVNDLKGKSVCVCVCSKRETNFK